MPMLIGLIIAKDVSPSCDPLSRLTNPFCLYAPLDSGVSVGFFNLNLYARFFCVGVMPV